MSGHTVAEERNALLDRPVRESKLDLKALEELGHAIVQKVSSSQPRVEDVASDEVADFQKTVTYAFEPFPLDEAGTGEQCSTVHVAIRIKDAESLKTLESKLGSQMDMDGTLPYSDSSGNGTCKATFQPFTTHDGVPFLKVWTTTSEGRRSLLQWGEFVNGIAFKERQEFQAVQVGNGSIFKALEGWVREALRHDGQDLAASCVEIIEEWQHPSGLCAKRQNPQVYVNTKPGQSEKNSHRAFLRDTNGRTWVFGAKARQGESGEWTQQLVTFTCTKDGKPSTIPVHPLDTALRSKLAWAEMMQCPLAEADRRYTDCHVNAFRDAHFMESPGAQWNLTRDWLSPKNVQDRAVAAQEAAEEKAVMDRVPADLSDMTPGQSTEQQTKTAPQSHSHSNKIEAGSKEYTAAREGKHDSMQEVRAMLEGPNVKLGAYVATFEDQGYDDVESLKAMSAAEIEEVLNGVQMEKRGHRARFTKWHESEKTQQAPPGLSEAEPPPQDSSMYPPPPDPTSIEPPSYPTQLDVDARAAGHPGYSQYSQYHDQGYAPAEYADRFPGYHHAWMQHAPPMEMDPWAWNGRAQAQWNGMGWSEPNSYASEDAEYIRMAKDEYGTRIVQKMLLDDSNESVLRAVTQNLSELMFNRNGIFVVKACFKLLLGRQIPELGDKFNTVACDTVMAHWDALVSGRTSAFSYKMAMWTMEFLYMLENNDTLQAFCQKALDFAEQLVSSNYGHLVLQHAVLFTQKALVRSTPDCRAQWYELRSGFFYAAIQALRDRDAWDKRTNSASHFINKCLELIASDPKHREEALNSHRSEIMRTVSDDDTLLGLICGHLSGQFTARRIYELGTSQERKKLERQAWIHGARIDKPELRDLEKFKASLLMPTEAAELDFPRLC